MLNSRVYWIGLLAAALFFYAFTAKAGVVCVNAQVMGQWQSVCWLDDDPNTGTPTPPGGGGSGPGGGSGGIGGGGLTWTGVWPEIAPGIAVNLAGNTVRSTTLTCEDEMILRQRAAQYALARKPLMEPGTVVTVQYMSTHEVERFVRAYNSGSVQFVAVSGCG